MKVELSHAMKYHPLYLEYRLRAGELRKLLTVAGDCARKYLTFSERVHVVIKPIRKTKLGTINGQYYNKLDLIELDIRDRFTGDIVSTFMHELVHAEQYFTGKLSRLSLGVFDWEGKFSADITKPMSLEQYKKLPWEADAYGRESELANAVMKDLKEKGLL